MYETFCSFSGMDLIIPPSVLDMSVSISEEAIHTFDENRCLCHSPGHEELGMDNNDALEECEVIH